MIENKIIIGGSELEKSNALLNLANDHKDIDKIYLYVKYPYEAKYQYLKLLLNIQKICLMD